MSHTATPWRLRLKWPDGPPEVIEGNLINPEREDWCGRWVCVFEELMQPEQTLADAERIVKCVNAHEELSDALATIAFLAATSAERSTDKTLAQAIAEANALLARLSP